MSAIVKDISENVGRIFRYILPGILIIGAANVARPSIFKWVVMDNPWHLLALAIIAVVAGNTWFVFHRYTVHQSVDLLMYMFGWKGPAAKKPGLGAIKHYADDLGKYVAKSLRTSTGHNAREHVALRASSMHLMYITAEICLVSAFIAEPGSLFSRYWLVLVIIGGILLIATILQNFITRRIDWYSVQGDSD